MKLRKLAKLCSKLDLGSLLIAVAVQTTFISYVYVVSFLVTRCNKLKHPDLEIIYQPPFLSNIVVNFSEEFLSSSP